MDLVSSNTSFIAAHISSVLTLIFLAIYFLAISKVLIPTFLTATPSANCPTEDNSTIFDSSKDCDMASASSGSTPIIFTSGHIFLMYKDIPAINPPPPTAI